MQGNPNKHLRKALYDQLNNIVVDGHTIPCYDERVTGTIKPSHYIILSTQSKRENKFTKCSDRWDCDILIDVITTFPATGNTGSKLLAENIEEQVIVKENLISLGNGLKINERSLVSSDSQVTLGPTTNVFRQLIRFQYFITQ